MGRNNKIELRYFPVDVDILRDKKVRRLTRKYERGAEFYLYLLCVIYSDKGYYMSIDDETAFDIADDMHIPQADVESMLEFCMSENVGLFSREMYDKNSILTSRGIQQRYIDTIRQLKRKVSIDSEYLLIDSEINGNSQSSSEETPKHSEETPIYSEEMAVSSEEMAINSDKSKVEESRVKENKKEEISLSAADAKERENFLKVLLFDKNLLDPEKELRRFESHYEKTGWVDANGNPIKNKLAAIEAWSADKNASKLPAVAVKVWGELYEAIQGDKRPMLACFRGFYPDGTTLCITASDKVLMEFLERPEVIGVMNEVLNKHFKYDLLKYRISRT